MKRIGFLLAVLVLVGSMSTSYAQKDRKLSKGFSVNAVLGFPSAAYGLDEDVDDEFKLGTLFGLQLGNRWYFSPKEKYGIGLMANWVDFSVAMKSSGTDWARAVIDFSFLEIGPVGTYALTDDIAIDGYYNLRPTVMSSGMMFNDGEDGMVAAGFGFSHALGAAFRWKALNVGLEYVLGNLNGAITGTGNFDTGEDLGETEMKAGNFRLMLGAKF